MNLKVVKQLMCIGNTYGHQIGGIANVIDAKPNMSETDILHYKNQEVNGQFLIIHRGNSDRWSNGEWYHLRDTKAWREHDRKNTKPDWL